MAYGDHTMSENDIPEVPLEKIDFAENNPYAEERSVLNFKSYHQISDCEQVLYKFL